MSVATPTVAPIPDDWNEDAASRASSPLEEVLLASHLLGSNRALANYGGGNTSAKGPATNHVGREVSAIWVKGSGSDLATMSAADFTPLRLDEILPLLERAEMSDEDMVAHLARCQLDPAAPRSSIETLLHASIPAAHVHHTHPDAINTLACSRDGRELIAECFGDSVAWIEYIRPGFTLAEQVGEAVRANPGLRLVVLAKHGLVVWGDTAREAYERTVAARALQALAGAASR
jgi:rhamnose utilization protein RhaD (predicted bifunctional aldolase and dehydrogenase)